MAFVNDYLTEEEKKKLEEYNLLYPDKSDYNSLKLGVGKGNVRCTLDREHEIYLFHSVNTFERRENIRSYDYFSLVIVKDNIASVAHFYLENMHDNFNYHKIWKLRGIDLRNIQNVKEKEVTRYLKEALVGYGIRGKIGISTARIGFDF